MSEMGDKLDGLKIDRPPESSGSRWWILVVVAVLLMIALGAWWLSRPDVTEVETAIAREVKAGSDTTILNASGYVTARRQATVSSKVTGKVLEVLIEEGMQVRVGQVLARLDNSNAMASVRLSEAQLGAARTELEETRVRRAEAQLDLDRMTKLVADRVASQAELDRAQAEVDSLSARLESQQQAVGVAERALAVARQSVDDTVIRAPFDGIVVAKNAQPGEMISPMSSGGFTRTGIGTIVDMSSLEIEVDVNEAYINRVTAGQRVEATLDAYTDWKIPSQVIAIIPTADRQTATVKVRIGFDELDPRILPDMGIRVAFQGGAAEAGSAKTAIVVPAEAIHTDGTSEVVFVVKENIVERRAVKLGETTKTEAFVLSGLAAGERVVIGASGALEEGDQVKERTT
ncbi:MAG: efflux RND transporter periplasmic adaptor subunit [Acidobacteriota bacterium]|nr:efflux RND transporter periplasmic adaptor subunit [Acidobacteriota bacterium]